MSPRCQCLYEVEHNLPRTKFCLVACGEQFEIIAERMLKEKSAQIDEYLINDAPYNRLLDEYKKYGSLVIAYDFDNTVYDFHKKGCTYHKVIELLRELKTAGCTLVCFTANEDEGFIRQYCKDNDIPLDLLNENPSFFKSNSGKIYYNALLDDRAGLLEVYWDLNRLLCHYGFRKELPELNDPMNDCEPVSQQLTEEQMRSIDQNHIESVMSCKAIEVKVIGENENSFSVLVDKPSDEHRELILPFFKNQYS